MEPRAVRVGMGVLLGRPPVGRPARVADTQRAVERALPEHRFQVAEPTGAPPDLEHPFGHDCHAGGVVAAVLEPLEAVQDDAGRAGRTDVPNDPTHRVVTSFGGVYRCSLAERATPVPYSLRAISAAILGARRVFPGGARHPTVASAQRLMTWQVAPRAILAAAGGVRRLRRSGRATRLRPAGGSGAARSSPP